MEFGVCISFHLFKQYMEKYFSCYNLLAGWGDESKEVRYYLADNLYLVKTGALNWRGSAWGAVDGEIKWKKKE